ncbi:recombinase family protein [Rhodococcus sp. UFZ-B548]|uniref:recombinase family protein n=1 Tax=Rhodococcus sp. UFZ-B548 TaxID=2742212 RepID=UPI0015F5043F|nr:recombinase family protein [Rhodococcus sp. UFZ-B548]
MGDDEQGQRAALVALGVEADSIHIDHGLTGTDRPRPALTAALSAISARDTLVVTTLERVSIRWDERNPSPPGADTRVHRILGAIPLDPDIVLDVLPIEEVGGEWLVPDVSAYTLRDTSR